MLTEASHQSMGTTEEDKHSRYTFTYRKMVAQHLIYFLDFPEAEKQLRSLLQDELRHYKLAKDTEPKIPDVDDEKKSEEDKKKEEKPAFEKIDLNAIKVDLDGEFVARDDFIFAKRSHPLYQVYQTLLMLADCFTQRFPVDHALEIYEFVKQGYKDLFKVENTIEMSYLLHQMAGAYYRKATERLVKPLEQGLEHARASAEIIRSIAGSGDEVEPTNFLLAMRLQTVADGLRDKKQLKESEEIYRTAKRIVVSMFGEDHPATLTFSGNVISILSAQMRGNEPESADKGEKSEEEIKKELNELIEKNHSISAKTYGEDSIHHLFYLSSTLTNKIALGEISRPAQANQHIRTIKEIVSKFHGGDMRQLKNQLFFQQQLLYAQMLEGPLQSDLALVELKKTVAEILTYVVSAQVQYCKMNMKHPFLEQTYMNIGIFNRSTKKFGEALMMWKRLEALQKDLYGDSALQLLYTYQNIGTCYLGISQGDRAREYFSECLALLDRVEADQEQPEFVEKDQEERARLYQSLYLTHIADLQYEKALECTEKAIDIIAQLNGPQSKKLAPKYYQKSNSLLVLRRQDEAIESILKTIDLHTNPVEIKESKEAEKEEKLKKASDEAQKFNRIQYQNFLCSSLFMQGKNFDRVQEEAVTGVKLCEEFAFEPLKGECDRMKAEFVGLQLRAKAKRMNTNALSIKEKDKKEPAVTVAQEEPSYSWTTALTTFAVASGITYLSLVTYSKMKQ